MSAKMHNLKEKRLAELKDAVLTTCREMEGIKDKNGKLYPAIAEAMDRCTEIGIRPITTIFTLIRAFKEYVGSV